MIKCVERGCFVLYGNPSAIKGTSPKTGEEYYRGYAKGAIYKLLSPCVRETSNGVAERVSLIVKRYTLIVKKNTASLV